MIKLNNITFGYDNNKKDLILNKFDCDMSMGRIISILGESGSGKSTILRLLAGLETPQSGEIQMNDETFFDNKINVSPEKRGIGMVFQDYALFPHLTVKKNIQYGLSSLKKSERESRIQEVLSLVHLEGMENRYPHELSGGQQQRVALARAIAPRPEILLLDEPFSNLDAGLQGKIRREVRDILKSADMTAIFVTHDPEDALDIADEVVYLKGGNIVKQGLPKEVLNVN